MNSRDRIFAALDDREVDHLPCIPISMMVASDLIGVPYRTYATDYREQVRGQIAFAEKFSIDHVSAISDPAVEASDCGADVTYHDDQPPALNETNSLLREKETLVKLSPPNPADGTRMSNRLRVVEGLKDEGRAMISAQFHPEAAPGPRDAEWIFDEFLKRT
jgi:uroporphyrinogen-III decarboxylase